MRMKWYIAIYTQMKSLLIYMKKCYEKWHDDDEK